MGRFVCGLWQCRVDQTKCANKSFHFPSLCYLSVFIGLFVWTLTRDIQRSISTMSSLSDVMSYSACGCLHIRNLRCLTNNDLHAWSNACTRNNTYQIPVYNTPIDWLRPCNCKWLRKKSTRKRRQSTMYYPMFTCDIFSHFRFYHGYRAYATIIVVKICQFTKCFILLSFYVFWRVLLRFLLLILDPELVSYCYLSCCCCCCCCCCFGQPSSKKPWAPAFQLGSG